MNSCYHPHFTDEKTEDRGEITCPRSSSIAEMRIQSYLQSSCSSPKHLTASLTSLSCPLATASDSRCAGDPTREHYSAFAPSLSLSRGHQQCPPPPSHFLLHFRQPLSGLEQAPVPIQVGLCFHSRATGDSESRLIGGRTKACLSGHLTMNLAPPPPQLGPTDIRADPGDPELAFLNCCPEHSAQGASGTDVDFAISKAKTLESKTMCRCDRRSTELGVGKAKF